MSIQKRVNKLAAKQNPPAPNETKSGTPARSLAIARSGLETGSDMINLLTATIADVLEETITTSQGSVVVNAVGKVLTVVSLQFRYGRSRPNGSRDRDLMLVPGKSVQDVQ